MFVIIFTSLILTTNGEYWVNDPTNSLIINTNLTVTILPIKEVNITYEEENVSNNFGDVVWKSKYRLENDSLLYSEIFLNEINDEDYLYELKLKGSSAVLTEIRFLNIGRNYAIQPNYTVLNVQGNTTACVKFYIKKLEQVRLWVEIFGRNGSYAFDSPWILITILTIIYVI